MNPILSCHKHALFAHFVLIPLIKLVQEVIKGYNIVKCSVLEFNKVQVCYPVTAMVMPE